LQDGVLQLIECLRMGSRVPQNNLATRLLLSLVLSLLFLGSSTAHAQSGELAKTGKFYADSVSVESGEVWLGLFQVGDEYELRSSTLVVSEGVSVMGMAGKEVRTNQPTEPLFLVRGLEQLQPGKVKTMFSPDKSKFLFPGDSTSFGSGGTYYRLLASGEAVLRYNQAPIEQYTLTLSSSNRTQTLVDFDRGIDGGGPGLVWAGDLDKDGKADLYMTVSRHYAYVDFVLFLSSAAQDEEIVGKAATWGASVD